MAEALLQSKEEQKSRWRKAIDALTPLNRVHSGPDMHEAYEVLKGFYPSSEILGYKSGSQVGKWTAPPGWIVNKATLTGPDGKVILDWHRDNILCLYCYSPSFQGKISKKELEEHLFSNPHHPDAYPYYFRNMYRFLTGTDWGFCIPHNIREQLPEGEYEINIQTEFTEDPLEMALQTHEGEHKESLLMVGHFDHPGQCVDGLLGCVAGHEAVSRLKERKTKLTYRMLSTVEIVGSVFYCSDHAKKDAVKEGLFAAMSGIEAPLIYATSASEQSVVDEIFRHVMKHEKEENEIRAFRSTTGNDEIAFDVQGVDIPCGSLQRWPYDYYHTSLDVPDKVVDERFENFVAVMLSVIDVLEQNATLKLKHGCLPCLSHPDIDLYLSPPGMSGMKSEPNHVTRKVMENLPTEKAREQALAARDGFNYMMTLIPPLADGKLTTLDIANRSDMPFAVVHSYTELWAEKGLLEKKWVHPFKQK